MRKEPPTGTFSAGAWHGARRVSGQGRKLARRGRKRISVVRKRYRNLHWLVLLELLTSDGDPRGRLLRRNQEQGLALARRLLRRSP
jgi:hypothetical protein